MTYPIKTQESIAVGQSASVSFTPDHAGLVKVILDTRWDVSATPALFHSKSGRLRP